jgi:hypothetical protein
MAAAGAATIDNPFSAKQMVPLCINYPSISRTI